MLEIEPRGPRPLRPNGVLPLGQSTTPYQIYDAFFDVTKAAAGWNIDTVKQSLNVLSETIDQTYPHLSAALDGVARFSDTIGKRDEQIKHLLAQANKIASVLGDRSEQINRLLVNAQTLLAAFNERSQAISALLATCRAFSDAGEGLHQRQPEPQPRARAAAHRQRRAGRAQGRPGSTRCTTLGKFAASLGEAVGVGSVLQGDAGQPAAVLDPAAVGRRGVQEARHRPGELLAQCRACRRSGSPTRTAPGSPTVRRRRRRRCSRAPRITPDRPWRRDRRARTRRRRSCLPRPGNPLPCADLDQAQGPFGPDGPYPAPPDVRHVAAEPERSAADTRGSRSPGDPGQLPPDVPGTPVPMPPRAARGAHRAAGTAAGPGSAGIAPLRTCAPGPPPRPDPARAGPGGTPPLPATRRHRPRGATGVAE